MGKIKNKTRLHAKAVKLNSTSNTAKIDVDMKTDCASVTGLDKVWLILLGLEIVRIKCYNWKHKIV